MEEFASGIVLAGDGHDKIAKRFSRGGGCEVEFFYLPCVDLAFAKFFIIERSLTSDEPVNIFFNMAVKYIFKKWYGA